MCIVPFMVFISLIREFMQFSVWLYGSKISINTVFNPYHLLCLIRLPLGVFITVKDIFILEFENMPFLFVNCCFWDLFQFLILYSCILEFYLSFVI
jgi:hypothetical protein